MTSGVDAELLANRGVCVSFSGLQHDLTFMVALPFCSITLTAQKPTKLPSILNTLGDHIKKRRLELGLFQAQLAPILGVTEFTVTNWENNRTNPALRLSLKVVEFLGHDPSGASQLH